MRRHAILLATCLTGCIKLDFFAFEGIVAESIEEDYHGLPLHQGDDPPDWLDEDAVEREIYLEIGTGAQIELDQLGSHDSYLHAAFLPAPQSCPEQECPLIDEGLTFIFQHGNSGHMFRYWYRAVMLWTQGANVLIYTYRGYGLSPGETSRSTILEDADTAMSWLRGRDDIDQDRIVAYGYSMGGIPMSYLVGESEHRQVFAAAVLESALDSIEGILDSSSGTEFADGFFFDDTLFDGPVFIQGASLPILQLHGLLDWRVPLHQTRRYYEVLHERPEYTGYLGDSGQGPDQWLALAGHRNLPVHVFMGENHISDYWDDPANPGHCCVHPLEYEQSDYQGFWADVGLTDGQAMTAAYQGYAEVLGAWAGSLH